MGWYLFRRQTLAAALLCFTSFPLFAREGTGLPTRSDHRPPVPAYSNFNQNDQHISSKTWTGSLPDHPKIDEYLQYFSQGDGLEYLQRCLNRAEPFIPFIASVLEEKNMPPELLYLPVIESAFRVDALSRSGAAGLWQFMMNSIDPYDITVDAWQDDRRDFWKSTEAALDKLQYNYNVTGDWNLALAAYNCGLNKVRRTIASSGINDYWELIDRGLLPRETSNYIPKLAAVVLLSNSKGAHNLPLLWQSNMKWERIDLDKSVDIRRIATKAGIDESLLLQAHGELNYLVTPPASSGYKLKVPVRYGSKIQAILEEESDLLEFKRYSIQSGDTLSELAEWYRIPVNMIYDFNPGVSSRNLRIGQVLLIPLVHNDIPDRAGIVDSSVTEQWSGRYTVITGDSLWGISRRFNTSPEELALGNKMPLNAVIMPGMVLNVPELNE
ncbi:LysM peptidoglycan-binding domain-containing protein [Oceanispirochaeta crateris]|nr:LysM peptidoglycan-binding domain-containing protein [Oceanispirochaeta crateris]